MLTQAWRRGARLPNDHEVIRRATGTTPEEWARSWPLIEGYWRVRKGFLVNPTQVEIYTKSVLKQGVRSTSGRRGGLKTQALKRQAKPQANTQAKSNSLSLSPNVQNSKEQNSVREITRTRETTPNLRGGGVLAGSLPRDHQGHVFCDYAHCVPQQLHAKLAGLLSPRHGGDRDLAGDQLKAWYPAVVAGLPADFVMGDAFRFWQSQFDTHFASKSEPKSSPFYNAVDDDAVWAEIVKKGVPK